MEVPLGGGDNAVIGDECRLAGRPRGQPHLVDEQAAGAVDAGEADAGGGRAGIDARRGLVGCERACGLAQVGDAGQDARGDVAALCERSGHRWIGVVAGERAGFAAQAVEPWRGGEGFVQRQAPGAGEGVERRQQGGEEAGVCGRGVQVGGWGGAVANGRVERARERPGERGGELVGERRELLGELFGEVDACGEPAVERGEAGAPVGLQRGGQAEQRGPVEHQPPQVLAHGLGGECALVRAPCGLVRCAARSRGAGRARGAGLGVGAQRVQAGHARAGLRGLQAAQGVGGRGPGVAHLYGHEPGGRAAGRDVQRAGGAERGVHRCAAAPAPKRRKRRRPGSIAAAPAAGGAVLAVGPACSV